MKKILLAFHLFITLNLNAQKINKPKLDSLFFLIESHQKGMGSVSIFENGKEVYQSIIGYASIEDSIKSNKDAKYRIGSISKMFTASIIMQLVEEGKLNLNTKLSEYYSNIRNSEKITIEYLLRHRSGIYNFTNSDGYQSWMELPISKESLITKITDLGSSFKPDQRAEYSNSNYVLLSFIAEDIEKKKFSEILEKRICKPCSLKNTYYGSKISTTNNEALSYTKSNNWQIATETDMTIPQGAGGVVSSPTDLNKFLNCLFEDGLVSDNSLQAMMQIQDGYGIGMFQVPFGDRKAFGHTGGVDGFRSSAFFFPDGKNSIAYTSNGVVMPLNDILIGVLSIYFGKDYELPIFTEALHSKSEELDKYLGVYSSPSFPLKITVTKKENLLIAQATGQSSFPLEAYEKHKFRFDQAMLKIEFMPKESKMILKQGGGEFILKKE